MNFNAIKHREQLIKKIKNGRKTKLLKLFRLLWVFVK